MVSTKGKIDAAIKRPELPPHICRALPDAEGREVFQAALTRFVGGDDRRWWWEAFRDKHIGRQVEKGFLLLTSLVPQPDELVWFISRTPVCRFIPFTMRHLPLPK